MQIWARWIDEDQRFLFSDQDNGGVVITAEEHAALLEGHSGGKSIAADAGGFPILIDQPQTPVTADGLCSQIDAAADTARRAVAGDSLRAVEYEKAAAEAQAFKDAGYPAGNVPRTVSAWAIAGRSARQAADNILAESAQYNSALYQIREVRLAAKEQVRALMAVGQEEQAKQAAAQTVAAIKAAVSGVGNARG